MSDREGVLRAGLDTLHTVEAPEGVRLELRAAGPVPRALAYGIDVALRSVFYGVAVFALVAALGDAAMGAILLLVFVGEWFYPVLFEVLNAGQTPGKRALGLRVVNDDGTPIGWAPSMLRNLLLAADAVPGTYLVGFLATCVSGGFRRLGDLAAGSLVIYAGPPERPGALPDFEGVAPVGPPVPLTLPEQRAVLGFAERAPMLTEERAEELAQLAAPLCDAKRPAREQLLEMAAQLAGRGARA